ncbi:MAG: ATP-dependent RecD-like DNA helicase [Elusimicrobia bacterium]|nr:ATP-dependent RecD-like DNA helicase [Elusimicrobiota bacterium]
MYDETLEGILTDIRYHGDGFLIGRLNQGATVKGQLISPKIGMGYIFKGHWEDHPKFGRGFKFEEYQTVYPTSSKAIQEYLVENAEGIGPKIAEKLTEAFGDQTLHVLKTDPDRVATTKSGITLERAKAVSEQLREMEKQERVSLALNEMVSGTRLPKSALNAIIKAWGEQAPDFIRENPYRLIEKFERVGFGIADAIARKVGFDPEGYPRIRAGVIHTLKTAAQSGGHVYLPLGELVPLASELLTVTEDKIAPMIPRMTHDLRCLHIDGAKVYLIGLYDDEVTVASKVKVMLSKK